jgi:hypothetical protein
MALNPGDNSRPGSPLPEGAGPIERPAVGAADWRQRLHMIIFEADTPGGRRFHTPLLLLIVVSVITVSLESIHSIRDRWGPVLRAVE